MFEEFSKHKLCLAKNVQRQHRNALRRLGHCEQQLEAACAWEGVYHEGLLLQSNLFRLKKGMKEVRVPDWLQEGKERLISLDPLLAPHEQAARLFRLAKKRRAAIPHLEKQILQRRQYCLSLEAALQELASIEDEEALAAWSARYCPPKPVLSQKQKAAPALPYHEFFSAAGLSLRVGKGAKSNEQLTFSHSKGSDWWFHVRDYPGSHVTLAVAKGKDPDAESVQDGLLLALAYSKAREEKEAEIVVTQCKWVNKLKGGKPGKVQIGQHKVMAIRQNPERLKQIKSRFIHPRQQSDIPHP